MMSIEENEEKARAYDEALERAKQIRNGNPSSGTAIVVCEQIFPELKESEDERMRKRAIAILKQQRDYWSYDGPVDKFPPATPRKDLVDAIDVALSYLEKQKGNSLSLVDAWKEMRTEVFAQASGNKPKPESDEFTKLFSLNDIDFLISDLDSRGIKQKPAEWNDTDMKEARDSLISVCRDWEYGKQTTLIPLAAVRARYFLEHLNEPKPADWSEEDEKMLNGIIGRGCSQIPYTEPGLRGEQIDWLKNKLKSLRPQPHWKPSEEQMAALKWQVEHPELVKWRKEDLESLYEQLKKL